MCPMPPAAAPDLAPSIPATSVRNRLAPLAPCRSAAMACAERRLGRSRRSTRPPPCKRPLLRCIAPSHCGMGRPCTQRRPCFRQLRSAAADGARLPRAAAPLAPPAPPHLRPPPSRLASPAVPPAAAAPRAQPPGSPQGQGPERQKCRAASTPTAARTPRPPGQVQRGKRPRRVRPVDHRPEHRVAHHRRRCALQRANCRCPPRSLRPWPRLSPRLWPLSRRLAPCRA
mmetsp:Transcript_104126/g.318841  ORF Transcript_104126/g.318841 Transcript_104126/m.318841 type:complete len:228 (+) Transcript_104126:294-977(+)